MEQRCPHCGAALPADASFCPFCARDIRSRKTPHIPIPLRKKVLCALLALAVILAAGIGIARSNRPQVYDAQGEVFYTDGGVTYQLVLAWAESPNVPASEIYMSQELGGDFTWPSRWFVNYQDSGANAWAEFEEKVDYVTTEIRLGELGACPMEASQPAHDDYSPTAAMVSYIHFTCGTDTNQVVWSIHMKNGDVIRLRQDLVITATRTLDYRYQDYPMQTIEELEALMDEIEQEVSPDDTVNLYLPPVTYSEPLVLDQRKYDLYGCTDGTGRTVFTQGIQLRYGSGAISFLRDLDLTGTGSEVGISAASRVWAERCSFTNLKTGMLIYGEGWGNLSECRLTDNQIGLHFNSTGQSVSDRDFENNRFEGNATAILLENVPTDVTMDFPGTVFTDNDIDIDNRCNQSLDLSGTTFDS